MVPELREALDSDVEALACIIEEGWQEAISSGRTPADYGWDARAGLRSMIESEQCKVTIIQIADGIAGYIGIQGMTVYEMLGLYPNLNFALRRDLWGNGITTSAVAEFLKTFDVRPIRAGADIDNYRSISVLRKVGFLEQEPSKNSPSTSGEAIHMILR